MEVVVSPIMVVMVGSDGCGRGVVGSSSSNDGKVDILFVISQEKSREMFFHPFFSLLGKGR